MPAGIAAPPPGWLTENGTQDLRDTVIPSPTESASFVAPLSVAALFSVLADPRPASFMSLGFAGPANDLIVHGRIHVIPRRYDLGAVVSEQEIEVEIWNAALTQARILEEINVEGPAGIEVQDHDDVPGHFPASDSQLYLIKASTEGDALIDNLITWVFVGVDPLGTDLRLTGFRLIPFPFAPNWAQPVTETFGFATDILTSYRGMEQRIQLRAIPTGTIRYTTLLNDLRDAQMANAILFGNQARAWGVGRWQFQTPMQQDATAGDQEIFCDTTGVPFTPGAMVLLWTSPYRWEVQTVESVLADRVILSFALIQSWTASQTAVLPIVVGRLSPDEAFIWESLAVGSTALTFDIDGFRP